MADRVNRRRIHQVVRNALVEHANPLKTLCNRLSAFVALVSADAFAQAKSDAASHRETGETDPTGGSYTTPTLLFIPAGALPAWNATAIAALDLQGPTTADRLASVGIHD